MEIVQELQTRETTAAKAAAAFGFNQPRPEDVLNREDFDSDVEYALAVAELDRRMNTAEYKAAARRVGVQAKQIDYDKEREEQRKEFAEIRKTVTLNDSEIAEIDREARRLAENDFATGKISSGQIGERATQYVTQLEEAAKDRKAGNMQFNGMFRREIGRGVIKPE